MEQLNSYFQIEWKEKRALCHIYAAKPGGESLNYKDVTRVLGNRGFFSYNEKELSVKIASGQDELFDLGEGSGLEFSESCDVDISLDKFKATAVFYPPSTKGTRMNAKDIMATLQQNKIIHGIDQEAIIDFITNPVYCTEIVIATATLPIQGKDAWIEYFFNTDINSKPAYNPDGSVDFHNINVISQVEAGQVIAKLHPEDRGKAGRDVTGREIPPRSVSVTHLSVGRNITLSEDKLEAVSDVTGHAKLYNGQVFVSDVYEVPADVDNSTGDIDYNGNVYVKGSIREGFSVMAKGDVIVEGSVEGALVIAGGQIIIKRGINGMNKGVLQATGNVISKFIENAKVFSGGYIETGSIINSEVSARDDVSVNDRKGFITGGIIRAGANVHAQTIGSNLGAATRIEIGIEPERKERYNILQNEISALNQETAKVAPVLKSYMDLMAAGKSLDPKNQAYYVKLVQVMKNNKTSLEEKTAEFKVLQEEMEKSKDSYVEVSRDIYEGVTIIISDVSATLKDKRSHCKIAKRDGEVTFLNL